MTPRAYRGLDFPGFARHQIALKCNSMRGVYERNAGKVALDLRALARNRAADRGNAIVLSTQVVDGEQTFIIYRCRS